MENKTIKEMLRAIEQMPDDEKISQGAQSDRLDMLGCFEKEFQIKLPKSYWAYMSAVNQAPKRLDWINFAREYDYFLNLSQVNRELRDPEASYPVLPDYLVSLTIGEDDNHFCFDTRFKKGDEYPLAYWSGYTPFHQKHLESDFPRMPLAQAKFSYRAADFPALVCDLLKVNQ